MNEILFIFALLGIIVFLFVICSFRHRRTMEKALRQKQILLQTLIDAIPSQSFYKDTQLRYVGCNKAFEVFAGVKRKEIIGKTVFDFFKDGRAELITERDKKFLTSSENQIRYETIQATAKGEKHDYLVIKTKFPNPDGLVGGFVSISIDVTDKKSLEKNLDFAVQQLSDKNIQIKDSVRIQKAILREPEELNEYFKDAFILFRPKDIISGDFYWFGHREDLLWVAAADCTGHGVPGALITILGNELLNQIVYEQEMTRPDLILKTLDSKLRVALQKRGPEHEIADGMDIAMVVVDKKNRSLQFSGAKNPMYFLRDGKLEEIEGSHFEIGGRAREKNFELHVKSLNENDLFYIFSDGLQDQFGGKEGRKLMSKGFKEWLADIAHLPLKEQGKELEARFENWKNSHPQIDDILVIGMKAV